MPLYTIYPTMQRVPNSLLIKFCIQCSVSQYQLIGSKKTQRHRDDYLLSILPTDGLVAVIELVIPSLFGIVRLASRYLKAWFLYR